MKDQAKITIIRYGTVLDSLNGIWLRQGFETS